MPHLSPRQQNVIEVFTTFLKLGLTSFGGPIAHMGYFRHECITRRKWIKEDAFADLIALCQFLPGPASSQLALALGLLRAGHFGACAAWIAFTLPSAILMVLFGAGLLYIDPLISAGAMHGLKLVAVGVVAQAVWSMAQSLCPDYRRTLIAASALIFLTNVALPYADVLVVVLGGGAGFWLCRSNAPIQNEKTHLHFASTYAFICLGLFFGLLIFTFMARPLQVTSPSLLIFNAFYQAGALVFGGGHVVLPLLDQAIVQRGWIEPDAFLAGYGAAQAMPGPLFTFAAYLGSLLHIGPKGFAGATLALIAIFLPGTLLIFGALPLWSQLRVNDKAQAIIKGANASVVGLLAHALYASLAVPSIHTLSDMIIVGIGFILLIFAHMPPWIIVILGAGIGILRLVYGLS